MKIYWKEMIASNFVTVDVTTHKGVKLSDAEAEQYNRYNNLHTIRIWVSDYFSDKRDEWNVTFVSRCMSYPRSLIHPENNRFFSEEVFFRYIRHSDHKRTQWHWAEKQ